MAPLPNRCDPVSPGDAFAFLRESAILYTVMKFNELNLTSNLMRGIEEADFTDCTPVQERTFKLVLEEGRDAIVQSQTGTGKTAAFLISIFDIFEREHDAGTNKHAALVVVPTRELAVQVADEAKALGKHLPYRIGSVFGGVGYGQQERLIEEGADIIIGTPGRLLDFSSTRKLDLRGFDILVLDEADRMLDMGFLPDVRKILRAVPPVTERWTLLFSATLSSRVKHLAWEYMNNPGEIAIAPERVTVDEITQELYHVTQAEKLRLLLGLLEREKPENALIFTNMKSTAVELAKRLSHNGLPAEYIMGDLPQHQRLKLIEGIKDGNIKLLVATDVAARGLHIEDLDLVVNYDIPEDFELYVHRIGRTARAGKTGKAITLACERYVYGLEAIESFIGQKIPVVWPDEGLFKDDASAGMRFSERRERNTSGSIGGRRSSGRPAQRQGTRPESTRQGEGRKTRATGGTGRSSGTGKPRVPRRVNGYQTVGDGRGEENRLSGTRTDGSNDSNDSRKEPAPRRNRQETGGGRGDSPAAKPSGDTSIEDRLSYYRAKYGEDFQISRDTTDRPKSSSNRNNDRSSKGGSTKATGQPPRSGQSPARQTGAPGQRNPASRPAASQKRNPPKPAAKSDDSAKASESRGEHRNTGLGSKLKRLFRRG